MKGWLREALIYQVFIDRFAATKPLLPDRGKNEFLGGSILGVKSKLSYLKSMGINCVWLSPFYQTVEYHGYHITNFEAVDPHFGNLAYLKSLIDTCHGIGMRIIADWVPNHCSIQHPFFLEALKHDDSAFRKWFYFDDATNEYRSFLHFLELAKFNLNHPPARRYMINNARFWLSLGFDGFRIDHAIGPGMGFWKALRGMLDREFPDRVMIGEVWGAGINPKDFVTLGILQKQRRRRWGINQQELQLDYSQVFHGVLDFQFAGLVRDHFARNRKVDEFLVTECGNHFSIGYSESYLPILFLDNHDLDRFLFAVKNRKQRFKSALAFLLSAPFPKVIYYGTEAYMSQQQSIHLPIPNADLQARQPMEWDNVDPILVDMIRNSPSGNRW